MRKNFGRMLFVIGCGMLIIPQSRLGLGALKWMYDYSFPGEIIIGVFVICASFYLMNIQAQHKSR